MSSVQIKNVVLLGGTSAIGKGFVEYLAKIEHPFNVTITTRSTPPSWFPTAPNFKAVNVDFNSPTSLASALEGQDAAVGLLGMELLASEPKIVDAAIEAGVKIFVPSDFGFDTSDSNPNLQKLLDLPVAFWGIKASNHVQLAEKVSQGKIASISFANGPLFDWGLANGLLGFDLKEKKATIYNGGDFPIEAITTTKLGEAVARALFDASRYINRTLYINSITFTQNEVLQLLEEKTGKTWTVQNTTSTEAIEFGKELAKTNPLFGMFAAAGGVVYDTNETYVPAFSPKDSLELGLVKDDLKEVVLSSSL